jgi:outer membrane protein
MTTINKSLLTLGILVLAFNLKAQEKQDTIRLSVEEAQNYAIENNLTVRAAQIDVEVAKKFVKETTAIGLPQIGMTANYQHIFVVPEISFPVSGFTEDRLTTTGDATGFAQTGDPIGNGQFLGAGPGGLNQYYYSGPGIPLGTKDNTTFNFTLSQLIFSGDYIIGLQAIKIFKEVSEKAYIKSGLLAKESVASTYYMVLVLNESIRVLKENLDLTSKTYIETEQLNLQGFIEKTDVDQLKINQSNLQNMFVSLTGQYETAQKLLKFQLGIDFNQPLVLTEDLNAIINKGNYQYLLTVTFDVNGNIDYRMMENQVELQAANLRRAKSAYLPTIAGFYQHQEMTNKPAFNFQPKDVLGVSLNLPIMTSGQRAAKVSQTKLNLEKSILTKENVAQGLILEYEAARNEYQTAFLNYNNNKESLALSQEIFNKNIVKFKEGISSSLDLTQSQAQYLNAEANYYTSINSLLKAKAKMDRILSKE